MSNRPDDPIGVMRYKDAYYGGRALVILGGPSGDRWEEVKDEIKPDVILGANGACFKVKDLDFWMVSENMTRAYNITQDPKHIEYERSRGFLSMFTERHSAKTRLISHWSWPILHLMNDVSNCVSIRRMQAEIIPERFSLRDYGDGYLFGWLTKTPGVWHRRIIPGVRVGTVAAQLIHHAGILGCAEVHTVGFDLCSKRKDTDHWYEGYPKYQPDRFRTEKMFTTYEGLSTQWHWIETAEFMAGLEPIFQRDKLQWVDHSGGLLSAMGVWCAK
jgi:hypothetical protein